MTKVFNFLLDGETVRAEASTKEEAAERLADSHDVDESELTFESEEDIESDYDAFTDTYGLVPNHIDANASYDGNMFETFGPELEHIKSLANTKVVWTLVDCDGEMRVVAGFHFVNRMGYFVSEQPWVTGEESFFVSC